MQRCVTNRAYPCSARLTVCVSKSGVCLRVLGTHQEPVTALEYLPDGSGFLSGGMEGRIIIWVRLSIDLQHFLTLVVQDADGTQRDTIENMIDGLTIRITGLAITPDLTRIVTLGFRSLPPTPPAPTTDVTPQSRTQGGPADVLVPIGNAAAAAAAAIVPSSRTSEYYMTVYDFATRQLE